MITPGKQKTGGTAPGDTLKRKKYEWNFLQRGNNGTHRQDWTHGVAKHQKPHHNDTAVRDKDLQQKGVIR